MSTLINNISTTHALLNAWNKINKTNPQSHGISDETIKSFENNLLQRLESISNSLIQSKFSFSPTRAALLPKKGGDYRPLQIPEVKDRVVIKSIAKVIESAFLKELAPCKKVSFAYQKDLGIRDATFKIRELINSKNYFVLEVDLKNFFGMVNKEELLEKSILPQLKDASINNLIKGALNQRISGVDKLPIKHRKKFDGIENGIPQGNALSPLLSNIYLLPFDLAMMSEKINLVRYADDYVVLCRSKDEALKALEISKKVLEQQLNLKIHDEGSKKWKIVDVRKDSFEFLSFEHSLKKFAPTRKAIDRLLEKLEEEFKSSSKSKNLLYLLKRFNWLIDGWASAFFYSDIKNYYQEIDMKINRYLFQSLHRLTFKLKDTDKMKKEFKKGNGIESIITKTQRDNSGIPTIPYLWEKHNKSFNPKITGTKTVVAIS